MISELDDDWKRRFAEALQKGGGLTAVSSATEIKIRTLSNYLAGKSEPRASDLKRVAKVANVSLDWLITGKNVPSEAPAAAGGTDADLMGALVDGLRRVYRDNNARIQDVELGRQAARHHDEISAVTADPDRRREMVALVLVQEKRRILEAPAESATRKQSA